MPTLNRTGRFRAKIIGSAVEKSRNGYPQFVAQLDIVQELQGRDWVDVTDENLTIRTWYTLGGVNGPIESKVNGLAEALGWDGISLVALGTTDWREAQVQVTVEQSQRDSGIVLEVAWINPDRAGPPIERSDPDTLRELETVWSHQFRAVRQGARKPQSKPAKTPPAAQAPAGVARPSAPARNGSFKTASAGRYPNAETAWAACVKVWDDPRAVDSPRDSAARNEAWLGLLSAEVGDKAEDKVTPHEWERLVRACQLRWLPVEAPTEDKIPF